MGLAIIIINIVVWLLDLSFVFLSMFYKLDKTLLLSFTTLLIASVSCMFWFDEHNLNFWTSIMLFIASILGVGFVAVSFFTENHIILSACQ